MDEARRDTTSYQDLALELINAIQLTTLPVGVKLIHKGEEMPSLGNQKLLRYCQAIMLARRGAHILVTAENLACPAAKRAFGFADLPHNLANGKALVTYGIVEKEEVGHKMFQDMPRLDCGAIEALELFPLDRSGVIPDIIIIEGAPERLMWVLLAYLNISGGKRVMAHTAILQATCVDATVVPFMEDRLNFSYGCYGCREATDLGIEEAVLGFPSKILPDLVGSLKYLAGKAIPKSREKTAYKLLLEKENESQNN